MNWIQKMFKDWGIKITSNPICSHCGKGFKDHSDEDLEACEIN